MKQIISDRRALHAIPELDRTLDCTIAYLRSALAPLRCELFAPMPDALCAFFDNGIGHTIAFRSGADALPVQERTFVSYASKNPGQMHSCGHDGHMAMLLELARRMHYRPAPHDILLIFQPAEETTGGARDICKSGVFEAYRVQAIFGLHLWPDLPLGQIASRKNEMMSRSCEVTVNITGRAASVAKRDEGLDALAAGVEFYTRAQQAEAQYPPELYRLMHFGHMSSGRKCNVVSAHTCLEGTLRAFQDEVFFGILNSLEAIAEQMHASSGYKVEIETSMGYPAVMNPPELYDCVRASGLNFEELEVPVMITEDFSWYQQHLSGMFFLLGIGPCPPLQSDRFNFDETALEIGADFLERLALRLKLPEAKEDDFPA